MSLYPYLFVDGGCLREALARLALKYTGDRHGFAQELSWLSNKFSRVFYYDALPAPEPGESEDAHSQRVRADRAHFDAIRSLDCFHVALGDLRGKPRRQKKVDVRLAVDMLTHAHRKNMDTCTLITGDVDFQPLIEELVRVGTFVTIWHPAHASEDLLQAADRRRPLTAADLFSLSRRRDGSRILSSNGGTTTGTPFAYPNPPVEQWVEPHRLCAIYETQKGFELEVEREGRYSRYRHTNIDEMKLLLDDVWQPDGPLAF